MDRLLSTEIVYFSRDERYDNEKPYITSFPVDQLDGAKIDNHKFDHVPVTVQDMRGQFTPKLDVNGFCFVEQPAIKRRANIAQDVSLLGMTWTSRSKIVFTYTFSSAYSASSAVAC